MEEEGSSFGDAADRLSSGGRGGAGGRGAAEPEAAVGGRPVLSAPSTATSASAPVGVLRPRSLMPPGRRRSASGRAHR